MRKIGVFDSGIGGLSVANAVQQAFPDTEVIFQHDTPEHFPYASKLPDEIFSYVKPIIQDLINQGCKYVVVACNTVSTTLITQIREAYPGTTFVATEPMVKPAGLLTKTGVIAVCATPTTLASERYKWLKDTYAKNTKVLEPDCRDWSYLIQHNELNESKIAEDILPALEQGADVIVLGCTHYHWIEKEVRELVGERAIILQPETAIIKRLNAVIQLADQPHP